MSSSIGTTEVMPWLQSPLIEFFRSLESRGYFKRLNGTKRFVPLQNRGHGEFLRRL
jgi:hypothetical protein